jgi:hypothetical protein
MNVFPPAPIFEHHMFYVLYPFLAYLLVLPHTSVERCSYTNLFGEHGVKTDEAVI